MSYHRGLMSADVTCSQVRDSHRWSRSSLPISRLPWAGACLSLLLANGSASADSSQAAAEAAFSEGVARLEAGEIHAACRQFESAVELTSRGALGGLLLLADCYVQEQRLASAWAVYKEVVPKARRAGQTEREAEASRKANSLEPRLARLKLILPSGNLPDPISVTQNGSAVPRGLLGTPIPVDAGRVLVEVSAVGYQTAQVRVEAEDGELTEVRVPALVAAHEPFSAPPPTPPAPGPREHSPPDDGSRSPLGLIVGGVGLLGLATSGVLGLVAKSNYDAAIDDAGCTGAGGRVACDDPSSVNSARDLGDVATVVLIGGGVLTALGAVLYLTAPTTPPPAGHSTRSAAGNRAAFAPGFAIGQRSAWLSLSGAL